MSGRWLDIAGYQDLNTACDWLITSLGAVTTDKRLPVQFGRIFVYNIRFTSVIGSVSDQDTKISVLDIEKT